MTMETTNNLYQKLWSASDDLRNFMDANEYKNYLLGIIFYKYLSGKQLKKIYPKRIIDVVESKDLVRVIVEKRRYRQGEYIVDTLKEVLDILINYRNNIYLDRRN